MNTPYPTLNFGLGEEIDMLRDAVYQMSQKEIAPRAADIDRDNEFPADGRSPLDPPEPERS